MEEPEPCIVCSQSDKSIDDCYTQVVERLKIRKSIEQVSAQLLLFESYHEKVLYVYKVLKDLSFLPVVKTNPKNDEVAVYYRILGNNFFRQQKNYEAWQAYNLSLLYAVATSEHFIYAVSNRSAVFFNMKKYEEALEDIKFVFSTEFPEKLRTKLVERRDKCQSFIAEAQANFRIDPNDSKIEEILKIKGQRDERYVSASAKLSVVYTKQLGRHVIANEDIKPGEVIVQEDPYLTVLLQSQFLFCCAYCLSRKMNLYPCLTCTYSLYCSVECRDNAYKAYHLVECGLMPSLISMLFTKLEWLSLRTLIRSRTDQENWYDMFKVVSEAEGRVKTDLWGCVKDGNRWVYDSKYYTSIHTLETNHAKRSLSDIFQKTVSAAVLTHFLSILHFLKSDDIDLGERAKRYVTDLLLRHIMSAPTNMHSISANMENAEGNFTEECNIASGAYAFHSLLNHSCAPNVVRYVKLGTAQMSLVAIRPIKKGMQVFDNYGAAELRTNYVSPYDQAASMNRAQRFPKYHHAVHSRAERQKQLRTQYKFDCICEACLDDWPLHTGFKEAEGVSPHVLQKKNQLLTAEVYKKLMKADKATAVECYEPLCELIEAFDPFAPCKELAECQEALKQCLAIFEGVIPFGYSKEVKWATFPPCASIGGPPHFGGYLSGPAL